MTDLVERLVPDELWVLFRRVVPPTEVIRPQGGGRRRAGDREALAAIIFVATSGCTWRQLPPVFGPAWPTVYRRFAKWSREWVWARLYLGRGVGWTGRGVRSTRSVCGRQKGAFDGTESDRSRQAGIEDPPDL
jgi:transposase